MTDEVSISETMRDLLERYLKDQNGRLKNDNGLFKRLEEFARQEGVDGFERFKENSTLTSEFGFVLWELVMSGVLTPLDKSIDSTSSVSVGSTFGLTPYGRELLEGIPIHRPNRYLDYLTSQAPRIDSRIVVYLRESLHACNRGLYFSSSVMLGVASETLFEVFIRTYTNAIRDTNEQKRFERKTKDRRISVIYDEFISKGLPKLKGINNFPYKREFEHAVTITFDTIRSYRDYAAHPCDGDIPRDIVRDNLTAFFSFCLRMYRAIDWLQQNKI